MTKLPTIPHDKALHAVYGSAAALVGALIGLMLAAPLWAAALALVTLIGFGKEIYDRATGRGQPSAADAIATAAGALPAVAAWANV